MKDRDYLTCCTVQHYSLIIAARSPWKARQGEKAGLVEEEANRHLHNYHHRLEQEPQQMIPVPLLK